MVQPDSDLIELVQMLALDVSCADFTEVYFKMQQFNYFVRFVGPIFAY